MQVAITEEMFEALRQTLLHKQQDLAPAASKRDDLVIERMADSLDHVTAMQSRDFSAGERDRKKALLTQVEQALGRMADGSYGVCQDCEEDIPLKRLQALPWACFCIACQESADLQSYPVAA